MEDAINELNQVINAATEADETVSGISRGAEAMAGSL